MSRSTTPAPALSIIFRQAGSILLFGMGMVGAVAWASATGAALTMTPPFLFAQSVLVLAGLVVALRGAPRWGYPWLALGLGGVHFFLRAIILPDPASAEASTLATAFSISLFVGLGLAVVVAALIAGRSWEDAIFFISLFLVGTSIGLPSLQHPSGAAAATVEAARLTILVVQVGLAGLAVVAWNARATGTALGLLAALLALAPMAMGVLLPRAVAGLPEDYSLLGFLVEFGRVYLVLGLLTFAAGALRRVFAGKGILSDQPPGPRRMERP